MLQKDIAQALGISPKTVSYYIRHSPKQKTWSRVQRPQKTVTRQSRTVTADAPSLAEAISSTILTTALYAVFDILPTRDELLAFTRIIATIPNHEPK